MKRSRSFCAIVADALSRTRAGLLAGVAAGFLVAPTLADGNVEPKWTQLPHPPQQGFNVPSDLDWQTLEKAGPGEPGPGPNWVVADDFRSDGRQITCIRWWGSYVDPAYQPDDCQPMPDGQGCVPSMCPNPRDECVPVAVVFDPASGAISVVDCDCRNPNECRVGVNAIGQPECQGGCPPGEECIELTVQLPDGTIQLSCECRPVGAAMGPPSDPLRLDATLPAPTSSVMLAALPPVRSAPIPSLLPASMQGVTELGDALFGIGGACCIPGAACMQTTPDQCADAGGVFFLGQPCTPGLCQGKVGTEIDGWLVSFHTDLPADKAPGGFSQPLDLLGLYFCPAPNVRVTPTNIQGWDGHRVYEYSVELRDCYLIHRGPDVRPGAMPIVPARAGRFCETEGFVYWLDIQAVVGHTFIRTPDGQLVVIPTNNRAVDHFWGWHTSPDAFNDVSTMNMVVMGPDGEWIYPPNGWQPVNGQKHGLDIVDQAFELLTPKCPWDFNNDGNVGFSDLTDLLARWGPCPPDMYCPWDFDCNGFVGFSDLTELLAKWGPC